MCGARRPARDGQAFGGDKGLRGVGCCTGARPWGSLPISGSREDPPRPPASRARSSAGQALDAETHNRIVEHLLADPVVLNVIDPKSEEMGDGIYRFKAEIRAWGMGRPCTHPIAVAGGGGETCDVGTHERGPHPAAWGAKPARPMPHGAAAVRQVHADTAAIPPTSSPPKKTLYAGAEWSGDSIVRRYLKLHGRDSVYDRIRAQACSLTSPADGSPPNPDLDVTMMAFGAGGRKSVMGVVVGGKEEEQGAGQSCDGLHDGRMDQACPCMCGRVFHATLLRATRPGVGVLLPPGSGLTRSPTPCTGRGVIRTVGEEIDRLEGELKAMVPGLVYVDLETDKGRAEKGTGVAVVLDNAEGGPWPAPAQPQS